MWDKLTKHIASSKIATITLTILLLIIGMATASLVNYISVSEKFAKAFYLGSTVAIVMILLGLVLFAPFFTFRFKYLFLDQYEEAVAKYLYQLKLKSNNWVDSIDGIIGIRLVKIEKHTLDNDIIFTYDSVFDAHSKYTKLNKIKPIQVKKNISLDDWIATQFKSLNKDAFKMIPKMNDYMNKLLIIYLNDYSEKHFNYLQKKLLKKIAKQWKVSFNKNIRCKSIHYTTIFKDKESFVIYLDENNNIVFEQDIITDEFVYWEDYTTLNETKKKPTKFYRRYFNLHLRLKNDLEGINDYVLQVIVDRRLILDESIIYKLMYNVLK